MQATYTTYLSSRTRSSLLARLQDFEDSSAWEEFVRIYRESVCRIAAAAGLARHDAEDVAQEVLARVSQTIHRFESRTRVGGFRRWLHRLTHWRSLDRRRQLGRFEYAFASPSDDTEAGSDTDAVSEVPSPLPDPAAEFETASRLPLIRLALRRLQRRFDPRTLQIFELHVVEGWDVAKITSFFAVSRSQVYLAKLRVIPFVRREVVRLCDELPARLKYLPLSVSRRS